MTWPSRETTRSAPADVADGLVGGVEDVLEEAVSLDFQKRVVGVDSVRTKGLQHELALSAEPVAIRGKANLYQSEQGKAVVASAAG